MIIGTAGHIDHGKSALVTALTGLASHREVVWIASAMSDEDVERSEQAGGNADAQGPFDALHFRSIGPASMSGRIADLAVNWDQERAWTLRAMAWDRWLVANGKALLTTTFEGSGFGATMYQIDLATDVVTPRSDFWFGAGTTEFTSLRSSADHQSAVITAGEAKWRDAPT